MDLCWHFVLKTTHQNCLLFGWCPYYTAYKENSKDGKPGLRKNEEKRNLAWLKADISKKEKNDVEKKEKAFTNELNIADI